ncbi:MAG: hypothetical protein P9M07_05020 [Candidatus Aceula meridiana]|nr:hypothetical protein [Candidatus Aceula meridiana]
MKTTIIAILMLSVCVCAFAIDFQTVSDASVKVFLQLYPKYKTLLEKYGQDIESNPSAPTAAKYAKELENLLDRFGVSIEDFPVLMQKVTTGFAQAQMEQNNMGGMGGMFGSMAAKMGNSLAPEEMMVIKKYFPQIEKVLTAE